MKKTAPFILMLTIAAGSVLSACGGNPSTGTKSMIGTNGANEKIDGAVLHLLLNMI